MTRATIRPDSGGLIELELFTSDQDPDPSAEGASIMLNVTALSPATQHYALSPETARQIALSLLEQVDAFDRWKAGQ